MTSGLGAETGCPRAMTKIDPCCLGLRMGALKPPELAWGLEQATCLWKNDFRPFDRYNIFQCPNINIINVVKEGDIYED